MPQPTFVAGTVGNLFSAVSLAAGKSAAAFLDVSTFVEDRVVCRVAVGGTAPTVGTTFGACLVEGPAPTTTLSSFTNSTTIVVASAANLVVGQSIAIQQAGGSKLGETTRIAAISGTTLTVAALTNTYSASDPVYLYTTQASIAAQPLYSTTGTSQSAVMSVGPGQWIIVATNGDAAQAVTVSGTFSETPAFA